MQDLTGAESCEIEPPEGRARIVLRSGERYGEANVAQA